MNIQNKLKRLAYKTTKQNDTHTAVTETTRLLAADGAEDMNILRHMGMHKNVELQIEKHTKGVELQDLRKQHGLVFTRDEICKIANRYALKFLRSSCYNGPIDPVLPRVVKEFFDKNEINNTRMGTNMYVLAPAKAFKLRMVVIPPDPVLFYHVPDTQNYILIHKWGKNLTPWRFLQGIRYKTFFAFWMYNFIPFALISGIFLRSAIKYDHWYLWAPAVVCSIFGIVWSIVSSIDITGRVSFLPWEDIWNTDVEPKTGY